MICKYWHEYDDDRRLYEYCKLTKKSCYCCGILRQCTYKWENMPVKSFLKRLFNYIMKG